MPLNIGQHKLTDEEELLINNIYAQFKNEFDKCGFVMRKEILGIGEPDRYLMCYFHFVDNILYVKFKNIQDKIPLSNMEAVLESIAQTIVLFKSNSFIKKSKSNSFISQNSRYSDITIEILENEINQKLSLITAEYYNITFDNCSNRLKNALNRNGVFTISDIIKFSAKEIVAFNYLGAKSQWELCEFLTKVLNTELRKECIERTETNNNYEMLCYVNEINDKVYPIVLRDSVKTCFELHEEYNVLYVEYIAYLAKAATYKLTPREQSIFIARLGINETSKTLQEIGDNHGVTRERIRQICNKCVRKIKSNKISRPEYLELEYEKCKLVEKISKLSMNGFLAYLYIECDSISLLKFTYSMLFNKSIELPYVLKEFKQQYKLYQDVQINVQKQLSYNTSIYNLIRFERKRVIKDEAFERLKEERKVGSDDDELVNFCYLGKKYQCESYLEKRVLERFLSNNTFKEIKTQSLKIPFGKSYYYPDFQCLTHENHFVIIEVKPLIKMCESHNIDKFETMKDYCEKYGFGYLIIDDRNNSFYNINEPNGVFDKEIICNLKTNEKIRYNVFREIYTKSNATIKNLLTSIRSNKLKLTYPFTLSR